jgi:hypothetical protein
MPALRSGNSSTAEKLDFASYRKKMSWIVSANYKISFRSRDLEKIREFLTKNQGHSDYELTLPLQKLPGEGTAVLKWRGLTTSLICLDAGRKNLLFLFITDRANLVNGPVNSTPEFAQLDHLACAGWTQADKTYLLLMEGDRASLQPYF